MTDKRFRIMAVANRHERLPNGDAPSFDVLSPPGSFVERYEGKILDVRQMREAQDDIASHGFSFDVSVKAWVKK